MRIDDPDPSEGPNFRPSLLIAEHGYTECVRVYEWQPGRGVLLLWVLLAFPLSLAGMVIFGGVVATRHGGEAIVSIGAGELPLLLFALLLLGALHEGAHGLVIRALGARPCYSAGAYRKLMPYLACTAPGYRFTKREYLAIALLPGSLGNWAPGPSVGVYAFPPRSLGLVFAQGIHRAYPGSDLLCASSHPSRIRRGRARDRRRPGRRRPASHRIRSRRSRTPTRSRRLRSDLFPRQLGGRRRDRLRRERSRNSDQVRHGHPAGRLGPVVPLIRVEIARPGPGAHVPIGPRLARDREADVY